MRRWSIAHPVDGDQDERWQAAAIAAGGHLTERYQLDRGGKRLRAVFTIEDTGTFSAPWSFKAEYVKLPGHELRENVCADKLAAGQ